MEREASKSRSKAVSTIHNFSRSEFLPALNFLILATAADSVGLDLEDAHRVEFVWLWASKREISQARRRLFDKSAAFWTV